MELYYKANKNEFKNKNNTIKLFSEVKEEIINKLYEQKVKRAYQQLFDKMAEAQQVWINIGYFESKKE